MPIAGTTIPLGHIRERRRKPHTKRTFERRSGGDEYTQEDIQEESRGGGWGFELMVAVAIGSLCGVLLFFAF